MTKVLAILYLVVIGLWFFVTTVLYTALLPGWGLNHPIVLVLLSVWVFAGGWYGAWKTKRGFHEQADFGLRECLSKAKLTMFSNVLVAAMAPPLLFITTSAILKNAADSIDLSNNQTWAWSLAWGSFGVSLAAGVVSFIILNEHIHSAISRKVGVIQLESERAAALPCQRGVDRMIQTIREKLRVPRIPRTTIACLVGAIPIIVALLLLSALTSTTYRHTEWVKFLNEHQDAIIQSLIVSSVMVAIFSALLRYKLATFAAGLQPVLIPVMFLVSDESRHLTLNLPLAVIAVLPLVILVMVLRKELDQLDNQEKTRNPIDSEKGNAGT